MATAEESAGPGLGTFRQREATTGVTFFGREPSRSSWCDSFGGDNRGGGRTRCVMILREWVNVTGVNPCGSVVTALRNLEQRRRQDGKPAPRMLQARSKE